MASRISLSDLNKSLETTKKSLEGWLATYDKAISDIKEDSAKIKANVSSLDKTTATGILNLNKALKESERLAQERQKTSQARKKTLNDINKLELQQQKILQEKQKTQQTTIRTEKLLEQQAKKTAASTELLTNKYKQLVKQTDAAQNEFKRLAAEFGVNSTQAKKAEGQFRKLDNKLREINNTAKDGRRDVGRYNTALGGVGRTLKNVASAFGLVAGAQLFVSAIRDSVNIFKDFQQSNANLASVLGKTRSQITELTTDAERLGSSTAFTATQVSELQTEFAKLGFNEKEIIDATEATLSLAAATGSDLGEAAAIAGSTLGGFGLGAEETQRVVDVMAKSFSISALDIEKFKESMKDAAPAAKAVGVDVEKTTALLGTLANAGISGSKAGTSLKTSFINLNKAGLTLNEGLEQVANSEDKLSEAVKLVGKNAASSFLVLAEGTETTKELEEGLRNAGGAADKMAKEQLNTLEGSIKLLSSAWEGLVLNLFKGGGALSSFVTIASKAITAISNLTKGSEDFSRGLRDEEDALRAEQITLNRRFKTLKESNLTDSQRVLLIKDINEEYGHLLPNLITEKTTQEELNKLNKIANDELTKKIILKGKEAAITELVNKRIANVREQLILDRAIVQTQGLIDVEGTRSAGGQQALIRLNQYTRDLQKAKDELKELDEEFDSIDDETKAIMERLGLVDGDGAGGTSDDTTTTTIDNTTKSVKELTGAIEKQRKVVSELQKERVQADESQIKGITERLILEEKELERLEAIGRELKEQKDLTDADDFTKDQKEVADNLAKLKQKQIDQDKKDDEEAAARRRELAEATIKLLSDISNDYYNDIDKRIDKQLQQNLANQERLNKAAENGSIKAQESLTIERLI